MIAKSFLNVFGRMSPRRLELLTRLFCVVLLLGLAVKNTVLGHWGLVVALVVLSAILVINARWSILSGVPRVPDTGMVVSLTMTILLSTAYLGLPGAIWLFPALVGLRFLGGDRQTGSVRWALVVLVPLIVLFQGDADNAARLFGAGLISALYLWLADGEVVTIRTRLERQEGRDPQTRAYTRSRLERDLHLIPELAPVGLILVRIEGLMTLRGQGKPEVADRLLVAAADRIIPMLSGRERLYLLGGGDFLVALAGWRSYESYELGQQIRESLTAVVELENLAQTPVRIGVSEVREWEGFEAAMSQAYAQISRQQAEPEQRDTPAPVVPT